MSIARPSPLASLLAGLLLLAALPLPGAVPATDTAQAEIAPIWQAMQAAANAHDTDRFLLAFLHAPELVFIANGVVIRGWDALREQQRKWWKDGKTDAVYTQLGSSQFQQLDAATVVTTSRFASTRTADDGTASNGEFAVSYIWRKLPRGWTIVYGHESWARH